MPGVIWFDKRVRLAPGRGAYVVGVMADAPKGLRRYWQREAEQRGEARA